MLYIWKCICWWWMVVEGLTTTTTFLHNEKNDVIWNSSDEYINTEWSESAWCAVGALCKLPNHTIHSLELSKAGLNDMSQVDGILCLCVFFFLSQLFLYHSPVQTFRWPIVYVPMWWKVHPHLISKYYLFCCRLRYRGHMHNSSIATCTQCIDKSAL